MKKIFPFLLLIVFPQFLQAQFIAPFRISNNTEDFDSAEEVLPFDFDDDGDMDLITRGDFFSKKLFWYENLDGKGRMDEAKIITSFPDSAPSFFSLEDINGDGRVDILGVTGGQIFWMKNTVGAEFTFSDPDYSIGVDAPFTGKLRVGDINGDGIDDIVLMEGDPMGWIRGVDGNGNFLPYQELMIAGSADSELADIDNDGDLDIIVPIWGNVSFDFIFGWYENLDNNATFSEFQTIDPVIPTSDNLQIRDFDGDGDLDLLLGISTSISNTHHFFWYENKLDENNGWIKNTIFDTEGEGMSEPIIYDIDLDGDLDLVTSQGGLRVYENTDGLGTFESGEPLAIIGGSSLSVADMNNDNILDIVSVFNIPIVDQELGLLYFGRADQTFENPIDYIGDADRISNNLGFMEGRDLNGNGTLEFLSSHFSVDRFAWQSFNNTELKFTNPRIIDDVNATDIDFGDFDGDGDEDIVVSTSNPGDDVIWYEKINGEDNFELGQIVYEGDTNTDQVFAVDLDNDGDLDIVLNKTGGFNSGILWFENLDGQGNFSEFESISTFGFRFIVVQDVDLDGDLDILAHWSNGFSWFENVNNVFSSQQPLFDLLNVDSYLFEDLDGNGWLDIIYTVNNNLSLRLNNGGVGDYADPISFSGNFSNNIDELFLRDYDLDGDLDLLLADLSFGSANIHLFNNNGGQNIFDDGRIIYELPPNTNRVSIDDYNGDKDMDIVYHIEEDRAMYFVENLLDKSQLTGKVFLDLNENAIFDIGEPLIFPTSVKVNPNALATYSVGTGFFNFAVNDGLYDVTCNIFDDFLFTTSSILSVEVSDSTNSQACFGVFPEIEDVGVSAAITSAPTRCGFDVPFWLDYQNTGTLIGNTTIVLRVDSLATFISSSPLPDSIVADQIFWSHQNLLPTHSGQIKILLQMPGVEALGEYLSFNNTTTIESLDETLITSSGVGYRPQVNCAYDPNDKLVEPNIPGHENFTLFGDTLDYVIRFQNTGTDTAFNVVIEDYLDTDLDYSTLNIIGASHPHEVTLDQNTGRLLFVFDNILLPDSTTNEVASHGYFRYQILPKTNLSDYTYLQNFASIFFDFNPPIITNTVENILVTNYPLLVNIDHPSCFNGIGGSLTILFDSPFFSSILWGTGDTGLTANNVGEGENSLTINLIDGTQIDTSFFIIQPPEIVLPISSIMFTSPTCQGFDDGAIEVSPEGGTPPYSYEWSNGGVGSNLINLGAGIFEVTITDNNACQEVFALVLNEPEELLVAVNVSPEINFEANGFIIVEPSGGMSPYSYEWSHDPNVINNEITNLSAGEYTVIITDANNCTREETIIVDQLTNTENLNNSVQLSVSPNPSDGAITVDFGFSNSKNWEIQVINSLGQVVRKVASPAGGTARSSIGFELISGVYRVGLSVDGKIVGSETVVVE